VYSASSISVGVGRLVGCVGTLWSFGEAGAVVVVMWVAAEALEVMPPVPVQ